MNHKIFPTRSRGRPNWYALVGALPSVTLRRKTADGICNCSLAAEDWSPLHEIDRRLLLVPLRERGKRGKSSGHGRGRDQHEDKLGARRPGRIPASKTGGGTLAENGDARQKKAERTAGGRVETIFCLRDVHSIREIPSKVF